MRHPGCGIRRLLSGSLINVAACSYVSEQGRAFAWYGLPTELLVKRLEWRYMTYLMRVGIASSTGTMPPLESY